MKLRCCVDVETSHLPPALVVKKLSHDDIVQIYVRICPMFSHQSVHCPLKCCGCVTQPEWKYSELEASILRLERLSAGHVQENLGSDDILDEGQVY